jgi:hypothetical protein
MQSDFKMSTDQIRAKLLAAAIAEYEHRDNPGYEHMQTLLAAARERLAQLPKVPEKAMIYHVRVALNHRAAVEEKLGHFAPYRSRTDAQKFAESLDFGTYSSIRIVPEEVDKDSPAYSRSCVY